MSTLLQDWAVWSSMALPAGAPINQRTSMKTAFFCGAAIALRKMVEAQEQPAVLEAMAAEIQDLLSVLQGGEMLPPAEEPVN